MNAFEKGARVLGIDCHCQPQSRYSCVVCGKDMLSLSHLGPK